MINKDSSDLLVKINHQLSKPQYVKGAYALADDRTSENQSTISGVDLGTIKKQSETMYMNKLHDMIEENERGSSEVEKNDESGNDESTPGFAREFQQDSSPSNRVEHRLFTQSLVMADEEEKSMAEWKERDHMDQQSSIYNEVYEFYQNRETVIERNSWSEEASNLRAKGRSF